MEWINQWDHEFFLWIQTHVRNPGLDYWLVLFRDKHTWIPLYIFLLSYLFFNEGRKTWIVLLLSILLITVTDQLNSNVIKKLVKRERPCNEAYFKDSYNAAIDCSGGYSFPSSHATNHMGLAVLLIFWFQRGIWRWLLLGWAFLIGFSQIYVGVHFPLDVVAGFVEGALVAGILFGVYLWLGNHISTKAKKQELT
ncbi:MAG: phosphatase PAP2 family protein [Saprospiraceae bacterium]|nr:phosphatase PAP2 family protein [Saprospiraceae bacterium]